MSDKPIIPKGKIVSIGDLRVARGLTCRPETTCKHMSLAYDCQERRIWCNDCEQEIEVFDAFVALAENYDRAYSALEARREEIKEAESASLISVAAREVDKVWRGRKMVPTCPCCGEGLFPEDFRSMTHLLGRDFAAAKRKKLHNERIQKPERGAR